MSGPANSDFPYLPVEFQLPEDPEQVNEEIAERERLTADLINIKENALYETRELLTGQQWFSPTGAVEDNQVKRHSYRKVINFGALPNATTKTVSHGISVRAAATTHAGDPGTLFTKVYGVATHPTNVHPNIKAFTIPYVDPAVLANGIQLDVTSTSVIVTTAANYSAWITCVVVLEYIMGDK